MSNPWVIELPWTTPPLTLNQRLHWRPEAELKAAVKLAVKTLAKQQRIPRLECVTAQLQWIKSDNRVADSDNIAATLKPAMDGLVAAGVLADDNAQYVLNTSQRVILKRDAGDAKPGVFLCVWDIHNLVVPYAPA